jgi:hypothetical protein
MANTFFLAYDGKTASIWCERRGRDKEGRTRFWVINGAWQGILDETTGEYFPGENMDPIPGNKILWEGQVPPHMNYNEAFIWLNETHGISTQLRP